MGEGGGSQPLPFLNNNNTKEIRRYYAPSYGKSNIHSKDSN